MKGTYRGEERNAARVDFRGNHVPHYILHEIEPLGKFLFPKEKITALDIGANKGFWTKALLQRFPGRVERVYMVDASPENYSEITNQDDSLMFDLEDFPLLTQIHCAIGEKTGSIDFFTNDDGSPLGSIFPYKMGELDTLDGMGGPAGLSKKIVVPLETIDNIVSEKNISHLDIVKIDIEGNELNALLGAKKSFENGVIDTVMFEFGVHQVEARHFFRDFWQFFSKFGFKMYKIHGLHLYDLPSYSAHLENFTECWNFVAAKE